MTDSFIIGAYWGSRAEPLSKVKINVLEILKQLSVIDEQFTNWYKTGMSRKQSLDNLINLKSEIIEELCLSEVKKKELDERGFAKMGFLFSLWSGHKENESSSISFIIGSDFKNNLLNNNCVIKIPYEGKSRKRLLQIGKAKKIIELLVEYLKPDYAVLTSEKLRDELDVGNRIGWITYKKEIEGSPKVNNKIIYEYKNNGHWFYPNKNILFNDNDIKKNYPLCEVLQ